MVLEISTLQQQQIAARFDLFESIWFLFVEHIKYFLLCACWKRAISHLCVLSSHRVCFSSSNCLLDSNQACALAVSIKISFYGLDEAFWVFLVSFLHWKHFVACAEIAPLQKTVCPNDNETIVDVFITETWNRNRLKAWSFIKPQTVANSVASLLAVL